MNVNHLVRVGRVREVKEKAGTAAALDRIIDEQDRETHNCTEKSLTFLTSSFIMIPE